MTNHKIVSREEWVTARKELLAKEKELTRLREQLSEERRKLPWVKVEKEYSFEGVNGKETLADLFAGKSQLIVYHFMFGPDWEVGCKSCSFLADSYTGLSVHMRQRDVSFVTVSRAPLDKLQAFQKRMGWDFKWVSSLGSDFNYDYHVSFKPEDLEKEVYYNYEMEKFPVSEGPGLSVFYKDEHGDIYHTYSRYARGLDDFIGTYQFLDMVPKGRDEAELPFGMAWVRHHDKYED